MSPETRDSKRTTKEKAAAARAAAEAEQRRRDNRVRLIGGVAIAVVVALIVGIGIYGSRSKDTAQGIVADAKIPTGVNASGGDYPWGVPYNQAAGKPTLAIWEDFQCPACGSLEKASGAGIKKLADDGKVNLIWRPTTFLDANFLSGPNPKSSERATAAWGCAIDAGKAAEYHSLIFANQPATEGDGWSDDQLIAFGATAGITGDAATTFSTCVKDSTYTQWSTNSYQTFLDDAVASTPSGFLNGTELTSAQLLDLPSLEKLITEATGS
jgi:protein-disulfide isomerase